MEIFSDGQRPYSNLKTSINIGDRQLRQILCKELISGKAIGQIHSSEINDRVDTCWKNQAIGPLIKECLVFDAKARIRTETLSDGWANTITTYNHDLVSLL